MGKIQQIFNTILESRWVLGVSHRLQGKSPRWLSRTPPYLVCLSALMENSSVNGCGQQVISGSDGVDIPSQVKVELEIKCHIFRFVSYSQGHFKWVKQYINSLTVPWAEIRWPPSENQGQGLQLDNKELKRSSSILWLKMTHSEGLKVSFMISSCQLFICIWGTVL